MRAIGLVVDSCQYRSINFFKVLFSLFIDFYCKLWTGGGAEDHLVVGARISRDLLGLLPNSHKQNSVDIQLQRFTAGPALTTERQRNDTMLPVNYSVAKNNIEKVIIEHTHVFLNFEINGKRQKRPSGQSGLTKKQKVGRLQREK